MLMKPHLLVVGAGSVGKRHLQNFHNLGCELSAMDPRPDRLREAVEAIPLRGQYAAIKTAFDAGVPYAGVVICSPPKFHVEQAQAALRRGWPVFLEKPVSRDAASAAELAATVRETGVPLLLGYTWRWWPAIRELRARLIQGDLGRIWHARFTLSAHLADWHPWERYQDFFMACADLGGGALLDESHFLDLMLWFWGMPQTACARVQQLSSLEIDTDDNVDAWFEYAAGFRVVVHLDLYGRPHDRSIAVTGEKGTLHWTFDPNRLRFWQTNGTAWEEQHFAGERNAMFVAAAREFLEVRDCRQPPSCTADDGHAVLQVVEAMRTSSLTERTVPLVH